MLVTGHIGDKMVVEVTGDWVQVYNRGADHILDLGMHAGDAEAFANAILAALQDASRGEKGEGAGPAVQGVDAPD